MADPDVPPLTGHRGPLQPSPHYSLSSHRLHQSANQPASPPQTFLLTQPPKVKEHALLRSLFAFAYYKASEEQQAVFWGFCYEFA